MDTKICKTCGLELSIYMFGIRTARPSRKTICRSCTSIIQKEKRSKTSYDKLKIAQKRYSQSEKGKATRSKSLSIRRKKNSNMLKDSYCKHALRTIGISNPSPELIDFKRAQLILVRITKKLNNESNNRIK